jgi:3-deoxy-7-phosphoheptulonate synthase
MVVVLSRGIAEKDKALVLAYLKERSFTCREQVLGDDDVIGAAGKGAVDIQELTLLPGVERVAATSKPYELASRETKTDDSIVSVSAGPAGRSDFNEILRRWFLFFFCPLLNVCRFRPFVLAWDQRLTPLCF